MKFFRVTSVFLCCALLSFILVVPSSAVDVDLYYSLPDVSSGSVSSFSVDKPVSYSEWGPTDQSILEGIYKYVQYLTISPSSFQKHSLLGMVDSIWDLVYQISQNLGGVDGLAKETTLVAFKDLFSSFAPFNSEWPDDPISYGSYFSKLFGITTNPALIGDFISDSEKGFIFNVWANPVEGSISSRFSAHVSWSGFISTLLADLVFDGTQSSYMGGGPTIYRMLHLLQDTLASDDDRQLAQNQKANREQIEKGFLTGQSGKTSLGKDDFGSLASVGGSFKDISSLNGQASLDSFSSGLTDADTAGQGWFSQSTKDSLDSVSGSSTSESSVSIFSVDGLHSLDSDSDTYNMGDFEDNYSWLWGDN